MSKPPLKDCCGAFWDVPRFYTYREGDVIKTTAAIDLRTALTLYAGVQFGIPPRLTLAAIEKDRERWQAKVDGEER